MNPYVLLYREERARRAAASLAAHDWPPYSNERQRICYTGSGMPQPGAFRTIHRPAE